LKLIAWDFDGVLNKGHQGGFDAWQAEFEADLGVSAAVFTDFIFSDGKFNAVLNGERDLLDLLTDYTKTHAVPHAPEAVLDYWLAKDAVVDTQVLGWLTACPIQGVIATNNEQRRADYMWETMGFKAHMAMIFASGPLGVKKPDGRFFAAIEDWSGLAPADILLIDDAEKNIHAARARGWQTFHFTAETRHNLPAVLGVTP
jgi:putative hydrolase of the HAD superfamily